MQSYFSIESAVEFRRSEWKREIAAAAQAAQARQENGRKRWLHLPHLMLASLRSQWITNGLKGARTSRPTSSPLPSAV